jgi:hypothetical protein
MGGRTGRLRGGTHGDATVLRESCPGRDSDGSQLAVTQIREYGNCRTMRRSRRSSRRRTVVIV